MRVSTVHRDISAHEFFFKRRYIILKYFRHVTSQKYRILPLKRVHWRDLVLGKIRLATSNYVVAFCSRAPFRSLIVRWEVRERVWMCEFVYKSIIMGTLLFPCNSVGGYIGMWPLVCGWVSMQETLFLCRHIDTIVFAQSLSLG